MNGDEGLFGGFPRCTCSDEASTAGGRQRDGANSKIFGSCAPYGVSSHLTNLTLKGEGLADLDSADLE